MKKIYQVNHSGDEDIYETVVSLPDDAKESYDYDVYRIKSVIDRRTRLAEVGKAKMYFASNRRYAVVEWDGTTEEIKVGFMGLGYKFEKEPEEETESNPTPEEKPYAPYTDDDMTLLAEPCLSELMAHTMAHNENLVVYKFVGDIDNAMQKSLFYGHQFSGYNGNLYTTAFLYARQMTDKYINDNRYGKTGDYRVAEYWYRTGKAGLNVTCWEVVPVSESQAKAGNDSLKGYTGDWDYDTRGRGEYSRHDGAVRGNYDVDDNTYEG